VDEAGDGAPAGADVELHDAVLLHVGGTPLVDRGPDGPADRVVGEAADQA
jgi:hypothetical protein